VPILSAGVPFGEINTRAPALSHLALSLTQGCNLRCLHCQVDAGSTLPHEVTTQQVFQVVSQATDLGARAVSISGGEPFLRDDLHEIVGYATSRGCRVSIETNGTLLTDALLQQLTAVTSSVFLSVSLDGSRPMTHDCFRGVPGAAALTIKALERASTLGIQLQVLTVLNRMNLEEISDITKFAHGLGAEHRVLILQDIGRASGHSDLMLAPKELQAFFDRFLFPEMRRDRLPDGSVRNLHVDLPIALLPPDLKARAICNWGYGLIGMAPNGAIGLCHRVLDIDDLIGGYAGERTVREIWESPLFHRLRAFDGRGLQGVCSRCLAARICRGRCRVNAYHHYGDLDAPDPICQSFYEAGLFPSYALSIEEKG